MPVCCVIPADARARSRLGHRSRFGLFAHLLVFVCGRLASRMDSDGRSSAPFSRRPLRFTGTVLTPEWGSSTPCDHPLERIREVLDPAGRGWRDRLASTKALLTVGTESASREALGILHTFIDAATDTFA